MISMEYNSNFQNLYIAACAPLLENPKPANIAATYLTLCEAEDPQIDAYLHIIDIRQPELHSKM